MQIGGGGYIQKSLHLKLEKSSSYLKPKLSDTFPSVGKYSFAKVGGGGETAEELEPSGLGGW